MEWNEYLNKTDISNIKLLNVLEDLGIPSASEERIKLFNLLSRPTEFKISFLNLLDYMPIFEEYYPLELILRYSEKINPNNISKSIKENPDINEEWKAFLNFCLPL